MGYDIRLVETNDAPKIKAIAESRVIDVNSDETSGLIGYRVPDADKYVRRMRGGMFYVLEHDREVVGYVDAYRNEALEEMFPGDPVVDHIRSIEKNPFVFINCLALLKGHEDMGLGPCLIERLISETDAKYNTLWFAIVHGPKFNELPSKLAKRAGFKVQEEIEAFEIYTFGLYKGSLDG